MLAEERGYMLTRGDYQHKHASVCVLCSSIRPGEHHLWPAHHFDLQIDVFVRRHTQ